MSKDELIHDRTEAFEVADKFKSRGIQFRDVGFMKKLGKQDTDLLDALKTTTPSIQENREEALKFFDPSGPLKESLIPPRFVRKLPNLKVVYMKTLVAVALGTSTFEDGMERFDYLEEAFKITGEDKKIVPYFLNKHKRLVLVRKAIQSALTREDAYFDGISKDLEKTVKTAKKNRNLLLKGNLGVLEERICWQDEEEPLINPDFQACFGISSKISHRKVAKDIPDNVLNLLKDDASDFHSLYALVRVLLDTLESSEITLDESFELPELFESILDQFCAFWDIPRHFRALCLLDHAVRRFSMSEYYFSQVLNWLNTLNRTSIVYLQKEKEYKGHFEKVISAWSLFCLERYYDLLAPREALRSALLIIKLIHQDSFTTENIKNIVTPAVSSRYDIIVEACAGSPESQKIARTNTAISDLKFSSLKDVARLVRSVSHDFYEDVTAHSLPFSEVFQFEYAKIVSEFYFAWVWGDVQVSLRALDPLQTGREFDQYIFALYSELKEFYERLEEFVDLPNVNLQSHFGPYLKAWLDLQKTEFLEHRLKTIIQLDKEVSGSLCSSSVYDLFRLFYASTNLFKFAPYSPTETVQFAQIISNTVSAYVKSIHSGLMDPLKRQARSYSNLSPLSLAKINNLLTCRIKLRDLLIDFDLENVYSSAPVFGVSTELDDIAFLVDEAEEVDKLKGVVYQLNCAQTFYDIDEVLTNIAYTITSSMAPHWKTSIQRLLSENGTLLKDQVELLLEVLWNDIVAFTEYFDSRLYDSNFIIVSSLQSMCEMLDEFLAPVSERAVLSPEQLSRIDLFMELILELLSHIGLSETIVKKSRAVARVRYQLTLHRESTENLISIFNGGLFVSGIADEERRRVTPYWSKENLFVIMKFRARKKKDAAARAFLDAHLSFLQKLF